MKRIFTLLSIIFTIALLFDSCKSQDLCPAYDSSGVSAEPVVKKRKGNADKGLFGK